MATPTGTDPHYAPVPPGWPGDDPTVPDDADHSGPRPTRAERKDRPDTARARAAGARPHASGERPHRAGAAGMRTPGAPAGRPGTTGTRVTGLVRSAVGLAGELAAGLARPTEAAAPVGQVGDAGAGVDGLVDDELVDDDDLIAGAQPAGRVLVVMVAALVLAMLVNADALVERAERRPPGEARDRALAVWHPVQDVSHVLQLYRVRQVADWVAGDDDRDDDLEAPGPPEAARRSPGSGRDAAEEADAARASGETDDGSDEGAPFSLRTPSEDEPLRLWVGGDFTAQTFGESLVGASRTTDVVAPVLHYESASGLTRRDYYDWPNALEEDVDAHDPEVVVVVLGANDAQGIVLPDGSPVQLDDPRWTAEYRRRAGALMDQLRADDRMVIWVGQPPMRDPDYTARMAAINQAYAAEAALRPWVTFVDPGPLVGDPTGAYAAATTDAAGQPVDVRQPDGIHLTTAGGDLLADHVLGLVEAQVDLTGDAEGGSDG